jgi:hypothetical protein
MAKKSVTSTDLKNASDSLANAEEKIGAASGAMPSGPTVVDSEDQYVKDLRDARDEVSKALGALGGKPCGGGRPC